jgi:hypothetical protein
VTRRFDRFLDALARVSVSERAANQFARTGPDGRANRVRRDNLRRYLREMEEIGPRLLLVGEAPSHRGGRLTGIPFVSETILLGGVAIGGGRRILGAGHGYRKATPGAACSTEASATMVWETIRGIDPLPLLWNAFPFHPFKPGNPRSNRMPAAAELAAGRAFILMLLELFPVERVVAVGNHADASLRALVIPHELVRHPSQGGKRKFVEGMARHSQFL